ncbi:MAG: hypothetical protein GY757_22730, partial [bacterium]|nr:hypothetical protein [bacterium]
MRKWVAIGSTLILGVLFIFASGEIPRRITPAGTDMETNTPGLKALGTIITVIPASGPTIGGTTVTIKGTSLGDGTDITAVTINGAPAAITNQSETRVVVTSGVATAGRGDVIVTSTSRGVSTVVGAYRYYEPPVVTTAAVTNVTESTAASGGAPVTIKGPSLGDGTDITAVTINGVPAAITNQSETRVVVTSGVATAG